MKIASNELEKFATTLETSATILRNAAAGIDYLVTNLDTEALFPTYKSLRRDISEHVHDVKTALSQLENVDDELKKLEAQETK